ncbi:small basic protein 1-like [Nothoprocta perdicaria]|uniref:small basic protein 1-like n=1 Tax=Nothoprocta perdicaria TaxID=30464 RepID=UPI000E1BDBF1|nr:small basic protein 1-like [Nothoprocta perdicaria]
MKLLGAVFVVFLLFSVATPGYGQPKNICKGYCSKTCTLTDQWTFHAACGKRFCCQPLRRKGK